MTEREEEPHWLAFVGVGIGGLLLSVLRAAVIAKLWQWFVADVYGWRRLGVVSTAGALLILGFASTYLGASGPDKPPTHLVSRFTSAAFVCGMAMLSGLVLVQFR